MDVEALKQQIRRGDRDAAKELLNHALEKRDLNAMLASWRLLFPARLNAWQAFKAALRVAPGPRPGGATAQDTQLVQNEITAQVLIASTRARAGVDPITKRLLDLAEAVLVKQLEPPVGLELRLGQALFSHAEVEAVVGPLLD